jgi:hypothetical protein
MGKVEFKVAVETHQLQWLHDALRIHNLPDLGKALRCLITYVQREENDAHVIGKVSLSTILYRAMDQFLQ